MENQNIMKKKDALMAIFGSDYGLPNGEFDIDTLMGDLDDINGALIRGGFEGDDTIQLKNAFLTVQVLKEHIRAALNDD